MIPRHYLPAVVSAASSPQFWSLVLPSLYFSKPVSAALSNHISQQTATLQETRTYNLTMQAKLSSSADAFKQAAQHRSACVHSTCVERRRLLPALARSFTSNVDPEFMPNATAAASKTRPPPRSAIVRAGGVATPKLSSNTLPKRTAVADPRTLPHTATWARAHCIGQSLDITNIERVFDMHVLHSARDYVVLSTATPESEEQPAFNPMKLAGGVTAATRQHVTDDEDEEDDDDALQEMPQVPCVAVFEFGSVVFFSDFNEVPRPTIPNKDTSGSNQHTADESHQSHDRAMSSMASYDTILSDASNGHSEAELARKAQQETVEDYWITALAPFAQNRVVEPPHPEEVQLIVAPSIRQVLQRGINMLKVRKWDRGNLETVSRVMGQSVALDYYTDIVDERLTQLERMMEHQLEAKSLSSIRRLGRRVSNSATQLVQSMRSAPPEPGAFNHEEQLIRSMLLTMKVINRLGVMDKDHTPWESDSHDELWQGLRRYLSIDKRSNQLLAKLQQIKDARSDLIQLKTNDESWRMEVLISVLIAIEIGLNPEAHKFWSWATGGIMDALSHIFPHF